MPFRGGGEFGDGLWETEERGKERHCTGPAISGQWTREDLRGQRATVRARDCVREGSSELGVPGSCREPT